MLKRENVVWFIYITLMLLYAIICNLWLISEAINNPILYVQGAKPVGKPAYYSIGDLRTSWSSILSTPQPVTPPYVLAAWVYAFPSNMSWVIYDAFLPFIGGILFAIFMLLFMKSVLRDRSHNNELVLLAAFSGGFMYEATLLSPWVDVWVKGYRALLPLTLILLILMLNRLNDTTLMVFLSMLTGLLLDSLYDIRIILSSIILMFVIIAIFMFVSGAKKYETCSLTRRLVFAFTIMAIIVFILRIAPTIMLMNLKISNPLRGIKALTLPVIVGYYDIVSAFGQPFPLLKNVKIAHATSMLLIAFVLGYILLSKGSRRLYQATLILISILVLTASIIYSSSPLKVIQQSLVKMSILDVNIGVLFRTPRFFVTINYVIMSMLIGLAFYVITSNLKRSDLQRIILLSLLLSLIASLAYVNVYTNNSGISPPSQKASPLPKYYYDVAIALNDKINNTLFRVLWLPRTGRYDGERPVWLKSICWGIGERAFPLRTYFYYGKPMEYIYPFIIKLGVEGKTNALSEIFSYLGVRYVVVVTDYSSEKLKGRAFSIINNLNKSQHFEEVHNNGKLYVFENLQAKSALRLVSTPIIVEGGLQTLADAIEKGLNISNALVVFADQILPPDVIEYSRIIIAHSMSNLEMDFLAQLVYWKETSNVTNTHIIVPSKYTLGVEPDQWHPYYITNPHHGEWEVFYTWALKSRGRYDFDFRHDWGFIGALKEGQKLDITIEITKTNSYIVAIRHLESVYGGEFIVKLDGSPIASVKSLNPSNSFQWFLTKVYINKGRHILRLENKKGRNALNIILLIPESEYKQGIKLVRGFLSDKTIVLIDNVKSGQKWPRIESLNSHIVKYHVDNDGYVIYINASKIDFPAYLIIPEQWCPDWSILSSNTSFENIFGFPSIFITALEINPEKHSLEAEYLQIKAYPVSNKAWTAIFDYETISCLVIVGMILAYALVRRHSDTDFLTTP